MTCPVSVRQLKFLAPRCQEFRNLRKGFICYYARLPRSKLRGMRVQSFSMDPAVNSKNSTDITPAVITPMR